MTTRTSGRHARRRRPISSKPALSLSRWSAAILSQSRAMIGPWLAAKTPTRLAMGVALLACFPLVAGLFLLGLQRMQARNELGFRHAADLEVEAQQIGIDQRRDRADVVREQRFAQLRLDVVAIDHAGDVGAVFGRELRI